MTDLQTPDFSAEGSVEVGSFGFQTEHAVAAVGMGSIAMLWVIRFIFPKP